MGFFDFFLNSISELFYVLLSSQLCRSHTNWQNQKHRKTKYLRDMVRQAVYYLNV